MPRFEVELDALPPKSKAVGIAGDEKAVLTPPSKGMKSSKSTSAEDGEQREQESVHGGEQDKPAAFIILAV